MPRVDRGELVGLGLEIGERGEDLAGRDEAALATRAISVVDVAIGDGAVGS